MAQSGNGDKSRSNLPLDTNGEVDWNALGDRLTAHILSEVSAVSTQDRKHSPYGQELLKPCSASTGWEFSYEKYDVVVFRKRPKHSSLTCFLGRGVIDLPLNEVAMFVKKVENNLSWDKFLVEAMYTKTLSESERHTDYIGYQFFEVKGCLITAKRDMVYYVRCLTTDDGKYVQAAYSVDDPDYPPVHGVPRVELYMGSGFVLEPYQGDGSRTLVNYLAHINLRGLPAIIHSQVLKRHPLAISHIRQHLIAPDRLRSRFDSTSVMHSCPSMPATVAERSTVYYEEAMPVGYFLARDRRHSDCEETDQELHTMATGGDEEDISTR